VCAASPSSEDKKPEITTSNLEFKATQEKGKTDISKETQQGSKLELLTRQLLW